MSHILLTLVTSPRRFKHQLLDYYAALVSIVKTASPAIIVAVGGSGSLLLQSPYYVL